MLHFGKVDHFMLLFWEDCPYGRWFQEHLDFKDRLGLHLLELLKKSWI